MSGVTPAEFSRIIETICAVILGMIAGQAIQQENWLLVIACGLALARVRYLLKARSGE